MSEAALFREGKCCWVTGTDNQDYCRKSSGQGASSGHCRFHNREFLAGRRPDGTPRSR
ncbi:MAG TPA: hypothetical protein VN714_20045 [Trebonia sp.]|jgi:hypothetical protein|nr:hypothetical protein [Trebonia sp.]